MRRLLFFVVATSFSLPLAHHAYAQESRSEVLRKAGDEVRFRVIERFSATDQAAELPDLQWPFSDAVRQAVHRSDFAAAARGLADFEGEVEDAFAFLKGYVFHQADAHEDAVRILTPLGEGDSIFADHARFYAALSKAEGGKAAEATATLSSVTQDSLLHPQAMFHFARLLAETDTTRAERALTGFIQSHGSRAEAYEARLMLARLEIEKENFDNAARHLHVIIRQRPLSATARNAQTLLNEIRPRMSAAARRTIENPSPAHVLEEYRVRFDAHRSEEVIRDLAKHIASWEKKTEETCEALFLIARSHTKLRKHSDGTPWYQRIVNECRDTGQYIRALYTGGRGYWNSGQRDEAATWFKKLWETFPDHSFADDAMHFTARIRRAQGNEEEARRLLEEQVRRWPDGDMAKDAHWLIVRQYFAQGEHEAAVRYIDGLDSTGEDDLYSRGRLAYFRGRALQKLDRKDQAMDAYQKVIRELPLSWYAFLAFQRVDELSPGTTPIGKDICGVETQIALCNEIVSDVPRHVQIPGALRSRPAFQRGLAFVQLELHDLARQEFQRLRRQMGSQSEELWALSYLLHKAQAYPLSHDIVRRHIEGWEDHYPGPTSNQRWTLGWPTPFRDHVESFASRRSIPPALIWSVMREESGFTPRIESWANARGLMQLMPSTAQTVARQDGLTPYDVDMLWQPETNIRLGSAYLKDLGDKTGTHPIMMITGYNGGWGNLSGWLRNPDTRDLDLWVEDIPFGQTRNYTKRVGASFFIYAWLYGKERVPRIHMTVPTP